MADTVFVQESGSYPYIPSVNQLNDFSFITGEIGLFEASLTEGPAQEYEKYPYFSQLSLTDVLQIPLPNVFMQQYDEEAYPFYNHLNLIPVITDPYPQGVMLARNGVDYPHYAHLNLIPVDFNIIDSNLKYKKEHIYDISYGKKHLDSLTIKKQKIYSRYPNGNNFEYNEEEHGNKIKHFLNPNNFLLHD